MGSFRGSPSRLSYNFGSGSLSDVGSTVSRASDANLLRVIGKSRLQSSGRPWFVPPRRKEISSRGRRPGGLSLCNRLVRPIVLQPLAY